MPEMIGELVHIKDINTDGRIMYIMICANGPIYNVRYLHDDDYVEAEFHIKELLFLQGDEK
jgi:hypothetical protein